MGNIISSHNKKILKKQNETQERICNCRVKEKENCPMGGKCMLKNIVYQATVNPKQNTKSFKTETYIGLTSNTFKARLANHKSAFKNKN